MPRDRLNSSVRLVLKYVGRFVGMLGAAFVIAATGGLLFDDKTLRQVMGGFVIGVPLLAVGILLINGARRRA